MLPTAEGGEGVTDPVSQHLETLFLMDTQPGFAETVCEPDQCSNTACWRVIWDEGACLCLPRTVCDHGRILIDEIMSKLNEYVCNNCGSWLVPAIILPLSGVR